MSAAWVGQLIVRSKIWKAESQRKKLASEMQAALEMQKLHDLTVDLGHAGNS